MAFLTHQLCAQTKLECSSQLAKLQHSAGVMTGLTAKQGQVTGSRTMPVQGSQDQT